MSKDFFAHNVRLLRKMRQMTQEQLAEAAGCARRTIIDIEAGRRGATQYVAELAAALDVSVGYLFLPPHQTHKSRGA